MLTRKYRILERKEMQNHDDVCRLWGVAHYWVADHRIGDCIGGRRALETYLRYMVSDSNPTKYDDVYRYNHELHCCHHTVLIDAFIQTGGRQDPGVVVSYGNENFTLFFPIYFYVNPTCSSKIFERLAQHGHCWPTPLTVGC
jgi:hypothetical protein